MKVIFKSDVLILVPETPAETTQTAGWKADHAGHVLSLLHDDGAGLALRVLGPREEVCREPIPVSSRSPDPQVRLIGNFAATPFELDGEQYGSVEGFWQSLRFPEGQERRRVAGLAGAAAKKAGESQPYGSTVTYRGEAIPVGTWKHWQLMEAACRAKFTQHAEAMSALIATGERPLIHRVRHDSKTIPGVIMADIWMRVRAGLRPKSKRRP